MLKLTPLCRVFLGLNFYSGSDLSKKITTIRKRFDSKFHKRPLPQLSLMKPMEMRESDVSELEQTLREELEAFYFGHNEDLTINFLGLGTKKVQRKTVLFLRPEINSDLYHLKELTSEIITSFRPEHIRYKDNADHFLTLGTFESEAQLELAIAMAREMFSEKSKLSVGSIGLFVNSKGFWNRREDLINFKEDTKVISFQATSL